MNVFLNTPGARHVPGLPDERCRPMSREPTLQGGRMPLDVKCAGNLYFAALRWSCRVSGLAHGLPRRPR
eukprot:192085-Prymnesium_polylepis.1